MGETIQLIRRITRHHWSRWSIVGLLFIGLLVFLSVQYNQRSEQLNEAQRILPQVQAFEPYYFTSTPPSNLSLVKNSMKYENEVLFFQLATPRQNQLVTVTEQRASEEIASRDYPKAEPVAGADGRAFLQYDGTRALGGLITPIRDKRQTFIIVSSLKPIPQETLEELLRNLRPWPSE